MSIREQLTLASGFAVAMACAALFPVFDDADWLLQVLGAVLAVTLAGLAGRRMGVPLALQPLLALFALLAYLCLAFVASSLTYGLLPGSATVDAFRALVEQGSNDIAEYAPPVPTSPGLILLSAAGVGAIALLVDLIAVVLDKAAVAGLPLLVLLAVPSAVLPGGLGWLPFVFGTVGWLSLLLVEGSERVGRWGTPMRSSLPGARPGGDDSSLGRVGRRIGLAAVGMSVIVPALIPGLDQRLIGGGSGGEGGGGGGSSKATTYNPITRLKDQLSLPQPRQLLLYETNDPQPDYLRMTTLDTYSPGGDGRPAAGWGYSSLKADQDSARVQDGIDRAIGDSGEQRDLKMKIAVDGLDVNWLPVPFGPTKIDVEGRWLWDATSQTVFSASRKTRGITPYTVQASRPLPDRDALEQSGLSGIAPQIREDYGDALDVTPAIAALTAKITQGQTTPYDEAVAIQAYFRDPANKFVYDLTASQPGPGEDALEAFLNGKRGFCEQYATAMAVLLREAGIPSRVAVGFTQGSLIKGTKNRYQVTTDDAHAWPEAWFAGSGWVRFEPTPAQSGSTVPDYTTAAVDPTDPSTNVPTTPTPTATATRAPVGQVDPDVLDPKAGVPTAGPAAGADSGLPSRWVLVPLAAAVLSVAPFLLTAIRRRRRWLQPDPLTAWHQLVDDASDVGFRWHDADSPRAAAARLAGWRRLTAPGAAALDRVAAATERARYAPPGRQVGHDNPDLRPDVELLRIELREGSPTRDRWRARVFPTSTLHWAGQGVGAGVNGVLDRVDDLIASVTRPIRRRTAQR